MKKIKINKFYGKEGKLIRNNNLIEEKIINRENCIIITNQEEEIYFLRDLIKNNFKIFVLSDREIKI